MATKKLLKAISAGLISSAIAASAVTPAFAGEQLGRTSFTAGVGLPWHTCENPPAKISFEITGGTYNITVINPGGVARGGESWWDCQFRHRKLTMVAGQTYTVKYSVEANRNGKFYTKIGNQEGDTELWQNNQGGGNWAGSQTPIALTANQKQTFTSSFTPNANAEGYEWAFQFGGEGEYRAWGDAFPAPYDGTAAGGVTLKFSDMSLLGPSQNDWIPKYGAVNPYDNQIHNAVRVNQVGYYTNLAKKATVVLADSDTKSYPFTIVNKAGQVVYSGNTSAGKGTPDPDSGQNVAIIDFSDFQTPGEDYVIKMGEGYTAPASAGTMKTEIGTNTSWPFDIGDNLYIDAKSQGNEKTIATAQPKYDSQNLFIDAFNYFYQNRATIAFNSKYITSGDKTKLGSRSAAASLDTAEVQTIWVHTYGANYPGDYPEAASGTDITAKYGWYDAGDHGKYVVNGGIAAWTLANTFERADKSENGDTATMDSWISIPDITGTSDAKAGVPKVLQEVQVELEFFMDMIVKPGAPQGVMCEPKSGTNGTKFDATDMVYHKLHDYKWTALGMTPDMDTLERIVKPPTTAATLNAAATFAQGARLFAPYDSTLSAKYLDAAKRTYAAAKKNPEVYAPMNQAIGGGPYGDDNVLDDFYWAACELYITTGDATYKTDLDGFKSGDQVPYQLVSELKGGENNGSFTSFNWGNTAALGTLSLWLNKDKLLADGKITAANVKTMEDSIKKVADDYLAEQKRQGYALPYRGVEFRDDVNKPGIVFNGYEWGSNSFVINNAIVLAYAYDVSGNVDYINGVVESMDYLLGRNAMDFSFVTGYGSFHLMYPHHRFWAPEADSSFPFAPAGVLSGGPNIGMQDPYIGGAGLSPDTPTQFAFIDSAESWSTNEVTINWNAPLVWIVKYLDDVAPTVEIGPDETTTTTSGTTTTTTVTTTTSSSIVEGDTLLGDVNVDGQVTISDLILLAKRISNKATLTPQGEKNAACDKGAGINGEDLLALIKYISDRTLKLPL